MREVRLKDLRALEAEILAFFGPNLLGDAVEPRGLRLHEVRKLAASAHPLTMWWRSLRRDIQRSLERNQISISRGSARLMELFVDLQKICSLPNSERIFFNINNKSTFYSAVFEAASAVIFSSSGYELGIAAEGKNEGKKTPDFVVYSDHDRINVEAKSLEDLSIEEAGASMKCASRCRDC